jgi:superfamily I DNA/RNA helicase/RecB family exonuclease
MPLTYRLERAARPAAEAPELDDAQRAVVEHGGGPLLVLAGPGTGKTTTLVEAVVDRIDRRGADPESVLVLTFSRRAAEQLRDRITARLRRTVSASLASTFHSFAYGLVRAHQPTQLYEQPLRLLSAPEQDVVMRQLLTGEAESVRWPASLASALGTRGFTAEVRAILARAREKGLDPIGLELLAGVEGRDEWRAAAQFLEQYLTVLDSASALDYPELIYRSVLLAERGDVKVELRDRYRHVFVDEYQDTDPSQVRLLKAIAGDGRDLVVAGDPDQSIYAFRGAEVRGILEFPREFPQGSGAPAQTVALETTRRFGPTLLHASRAVAARIPAGGAIAAAIVRTFRRPEAAASDAGEGQVEVRCHDTERAEFEHLADELRRAHLVDGVDWSDMAVLVRSGRAMIPPLRRALSAAGVPVEVASDDTPLVREPAVLPLLDALRVVVNLRNDDPQHPDYIDAARAESLFLSPLGGLDAVELRALARRLRLRDQASAEEAGHTPRSSGELIRDALVDPAAIVGLDGPGASGVSVVRKATDLAELLSRARDQVESEATAEEVLWTLWSSTAWPRRLRASVEAGGAQARLAHRDLDALCALFEVAARAEEQRGHTSVANFLDALSAQQIPADTLADRGVRGSAVRLLTAHRSKGLEWRLVVVAHVQEGSWPDLRRRTTLLQADRIGADGVLPPTTTQSLLAEERRLFYVACTRARERLLVTAVRSPDDDGEQPSRLIDELGVEVVGVRGRPERPLSLPGLIADLRRTVADDDSSRALRTAAAKRLAMLAAAEHRGRPLAAQAHPATWWGTHARTAATRPLRPPDQPIRLSATMLDALLACPTKWFLEQEAGGERETSASQGFGLVVHAIADRIGKRELSGADDLMALVDEVWGQLSFRTPWSGEKERAEVQAALERFVRWQARPDAREVLATEKQLTADVTLPDGQVVRLVGYADRLEIDADGRVVVVDLKTGKYPPRDKDVPANPQLGLYQHAINHGAVDDLVPSAASGGAELLQLRKEVQGEAKVQRQPPPDYDETGPAAVESQLMEAVAVVRSERLVARAGPQCDHCDFHAVCPIKGAGTVLS